MDCPDLINGFEDKKKKKEAEKGVKRKSTTNGAKGDEQAKKKKKEGGKSVSLFFSILKSSKSKINVSLSSALKTNGSLVKTWIVLI